MKQASVLALAAALCAGIAAGAPVRAQSPGPSRAQGLSTATTIDAKFRLPHAIDIAEREGRGKATEATLSPFPRGGGVLEVTVMRADKSIVKYSVDANTGEVTNATEQTLEPYVSTLDAGALQANTYSMREAVSAAEAQIAGGVAIGAKVDNDDKSFAYEVNVFKDGAETGFHVTSDGKAVKS